MESVADKGSDKSFLPQHGNLCKICSQNQARYVCPKCNIPYCSLPCYQSEVHIDCSENFYKENVIAEIKNDNLNPQSQKKMLEILQRLQQDDENFTDDRLEDSDDEGSGEDLAARLAGIDIDDADSVWQHLTQQERAEFEQLLRSGDVSEIVPEWQPWWYYRENKQLVVDIDAASHPQNDSEDVLPIPPVRQDIQLLSKISKVTPSPNVRWSVVNLLAAYSVTGRVYNGDHLSSPVEAAATLMTLSASLTSAQVYDNPELSIAAVRLAAVQDNCFVEGVDESQLKEDVKKLGEGPCQAKQERFVLAALSDIHQLLASAKRQAKEKSKKVIEGEFSKRFPKNCAPAVTSSEYNKCIKKVEYLMSWTKEYY